MSFPPTDRPGIKICGITSPVQAEQICALGADALGINFWPKSKRYLPPEKSEWLADLKETVTLISVLVNPEPALLDWLVETRPVHTLQLHGDETPQFTEKLMSRGVDVIKALQIRDESSLEAIGQYPCQTLLLDAYNPGLYGGVGETFPWELAVMARERFPDKRIILSGGLTPNNVRQAILQTRLAGVDVASGVESAPGIKDIGLVKHFIDEARSAQA